MKDGFLPPKTKAFYMNIPGTCWLCNKSVSSFLTDLHLLQCSGLDHKAVDYFVQSVMKKTHLKHKLVIEAAKQYSKFELNENTIPNRFFKKSDDYDYFTSELENLTQELALTAFLSLDIPEVYENFNILKYTK